MGNVIGLLIVLVAAYFLFRGQGERRRNKVEEAARRTTEQQVRAREREAESDTLEPCPVCEAYVAREQGACERADCPRR